MAKRGSIADHRVMAAFRIDPRISEAVRQFPHGKVQEVFAAATLAFLNADPETQRSLLIDLREFELRQDAPVIRAGLSSKAR